MSVSRYKNGHRRRQVRAQVLAEETHCWICGQVVDKTLHYLNGGAPQVDELLPVSLGGSPIDRTNCRLAHRNCNIRRGNGTKIRNSPTTTIKRVRQW
jgi:5-methylcytosine-specific restriction endonuclease McrA